MYLNTLKKISQSKYAAVVAVAAFAAIVVVSMLILFRVAKIESQRDMVNWENRINIVADSRANAVNEWVAREFSELTSLAQNQSLQLYASELMQPQMNQKEDPYQISYLRNLLTFTAERGGFSSAQPTINANIPTVSQAGIAVLDKDKRVLVSTVSMPPLSGRLAEIIANLPAMENYISNIYKSSNGSSSIVFSVPILPVQGDEGKNIVGYVVAIQPVEDSLFALLKPPGATEKTAETLLVSMDGDMVNYLSPTSDGTPALTKNLNIDPELEAAFAVQNPGKVAVKRDYSFNKVLVTGRKITHTPWTLVYKIDRDEAMYESDTHNRNLIIIGIITIFFITAAIIAMWQYANFLKESRVAERYRKMLLELKSQKHILRLITDNKPEVTLIVDAKNRCRFANLKAAQQAGISAKEMVGQTLVSLLGKDRAMPYIKLNAAALADNRPILTTQRFSENGEEKVIQSCHVPIMHIPSPEDGVSREGVLIIEQDITAPILAKEKLVRMLDGLIDTLVSFMDRRDAYTANHSVRVARLAVKIAEEMGLDKIMVETVSIAGRLMNLGRALIPLNVLTKFENLTDVEKKMFEETVLVSAELLHEIEFEGPVVETIKQSNEAVDGSGLMRLSGEEIIITARILAVANSFVSLRSPRAYRLMKTLDETMQSITESSGTKFDRKVVAALVNYIENRGGRDEWRAPEEIPPLWVA